MSSRLRLAAAALALLLAAACGAEDGEPLTEGSPEAPGSPAPGAGAASATPGAGTPTADPASPTPAPSPDEPATSLSSEAWSALADAPQPLTEVAAAPLGGNVLTAGGFDGEGRAVDTVLAYDPTFDRWAAGPSLPEAVHHTALVSTGSGVLQIGGYRGSGFGEPTAAVHRLDPATGSWHEHAPLPEPRAAGAAAWDGGRVVYAGGVGPDGLAGDIYALDGGSGEWARIGALAEPREHLAAAGDGDGSAWFLAGRTGGLDANLASVERVTGERVVTVGELPTARGGVAGFWHPRAGACAAGGEGPDGTFAEVECIDAEDEVTVLPQLANARHGLGAAAVDDIAYALLGGPEPRLTVSATVEALLLD